MHMLQHVVLIAFVPPLVVLAAPWLTVWRAFPLDTRRSRAHAVLRLPAGVRRGLRGLVSPVVAFGLITASPRRLARPRPLRPDAPERGRPRPRARDSSSSSGSCSGSRSSTRRRSTRASATSERALYAGAGAVTGWLLALVLAFASTPLYPAYAALPRRLGGLSALADQQLAAGVMLGIGSIPYTIAVFVFVYRWLDEERPAVTRRTALTTSPGAVGIEEERALVARRVDHVGRLGVVDRADGDARERLRVTWTPIA